MVVDNRATGGDIRLRSMAFPGALTLPVRIGGGVEVVSRFPVRIVNALASDIVTRALDGLWSVEEVKDRFLRRLEGLLWDLGKILLFTGCTIPPTRVFTDRRSMFSSKSLMTDGVVQMRLVTGLFRFVRRLSHSPQAFVTR